MRDEKLIIRCPYCGAEYTPSELYYPDDFLPKIKDILKDDDEKIISYTGNIMNLSTEYCCDKCGHTFKVTADIKFKSTECNQHDFDNEFVEPLYNTPRTELKED